MWKVVTADIEMPAVLLLFDKETIELLRPVHGLSKSTSSILVASTKTAGTSKTVNSLASRRAAAPKRNKAQ